MNLDNLVSDNDKEHTCPFCQKTLSIITGNKTYEALKQVGYECENCFIPEAKTISGKPFSRYNLSVMKDVDYEDGKQIQFIVNETFFIHFKDNQWYNVHNSVAKQQTTLVLTKPMQITDVVYADEQPYGLVWVSGVVILPFIETWNLTDQEKTISKIRTYLIFS